MQTPTSSRSPFPWVALAIACLVIAGVTLWRSQPRAAVASPVVEAVATDVVAPPVRPAPPLASLATSAPTDPAALAEASVREHARVQEIVDRTRETFIARHARERVDTAWSNPKERELASLADSDQIRALHANIANLEVDCRTSMCLVRGDVPSVTAGDDWFTLYMTNVGSAMPEAAYRYVRNDDGSLRIEVFGIARR